ERQGRRRRVRGRHRQEQEDGLRLSRNKKEDEPASRASGRPTYKREVGAAERACRRTITSCSESAARRALTTSRRRSASSPCSIIRTATRATKSPRSSSRASIT